MTTDHRGARATGVLVGLCLVVGAVWALLPAMLGAAGGPEPELISAFRTAELARAPIPVPGGPPFEPRSLRFDRFSITVDGDHASAVATLDAAGSCGSVEVSSLGRERVGFRRHGGRWEPEGPIAPALAQALSVLWQRSRLLSGSAAASLEGLVLPADRERALQDARIDSVLRLPGHRWEPRAWYLRSERGEVLVTEEANLTSSSREPEPRTGRLRLVPSGEDGSFVFAGGLL
ncbi:MAG TPA: hypothetical protein VGF31_12720 [Myxococcaceae bacterium]